MRCGFSGGFSGIKKLISEKKSCFYGGLKNLFKKTFMCKISLEYNLKTKFSLKQVALQVELGEFRGNFGGVRKMFLKYLSVRCARKDANLAQVRLASIHQTESANVPNISSSAPLDRSTNTSRKR